MPRVCGAESEEALVVDIGGSGRRKVQACNILNLNKILCSWIYQHWNNSE
jgi:hypothetical protein